MKRKTKKAKLAEKSNAEARVRSMINATLTINTIHSKTLDVSTVVSELLSDAKKLQQHDLTAIEETLLSQAQTLDVFFHKCLSLGVQSDFMPHMQIYADLALRAQSNSRKTLTTLIDLKNPKRTTFIAQQNNAINQQINNSEKLENPANELLSQEVPHETLELGRAQETITIDSSVGTLEKVHRR